MEYKLLDKKEQLFGIRYQFISVKNLVYTLCYKQS